jgi:hypothetical protein
MMHYLLCHFQPIVSMNSRKVLRKGLITYYKTSGITCLHKHLDVNHSTIYKIFQEKINNQGKENIFKKNANKRSLISNFPYLNFSLQKILLKKMMWIKRCLWRILQF